ncbi:MAG: phage integrase N-terminal SAM-like domain-containing protein [Verrucomicrobia bacterium]|nr:phage integrase N-terminal SAM-like domain-containing protein [Verrucomicrobiota bacterium]
MKQKKYLTFLPVKSKVSASTQNQALNGLLFFYRHILKKDFGQLKDVPRAKRRPYIQGMFKRGCSQSQANEKSFRAHISSQFHWKLT